jgi:hypothetical protein
MHVKRWLAHDGAGAQFVVVDKSPPESVIDDVILHRPHPGSSAWTTSPYGEATSTAPPWAGTNRSNAPAAAAPTDPPPATRIGPVEDRRYGEACL